LKKLVTVVLAGLVVALAVTAFAGAAPAAS